MRTRKLRDVMIYLCSHYPHKGELSKARLTKMVYLADWKNALEQGEQITDINWFFDHYGPYVAKVSDLARQNNIFRVVPSVNAQGGKKDVIQIRPDIPTGKLMLSLAERKILDFIIAETEQLTWNGFIQLVYKTFPIVASDRYYNLDLTGLAEYYRQEVRPQSSSPLFDPLDRPLEHLHDSLAF